MQLTPSWLYLLFAAFMLFSAAYATTLLLISAATRKPAGADVQVSHLAMGLAMAGMFEGRLAFGVNTIWELVFALLLVWFIARGIRSVQVYGPHLPHTFVHALMSLAMLLMYWFPMAAAAKGGTGMSMSSTGGGHVDPGLAFVIAVALFASAVFTLASPRKGASVYGTHVMLKNAGSAPDEAYLLPSPSSAGGVEGLIASPRLVDLSHVMMCVAMGFMVVLML